MRALLIDDAARAEIRRVAGHAVRHPFGEAEMLRRVGDPLIPPVGDSPEFACEVPLGYRCVYTVERQLIGWCRHLSVSLLGQAVRGLGPSPEAVSWLMAEFGFSGGVRDAITYVEPLGEGCFAVNLLQALRDGEIVEVPS